jgi:saccharopine dehydrogenase-like NADP-dependent oxidoreductase
MKAMVMGMGLQGKAVVHDLESSDRIETIFAADLFPTKESLAKAQTYLTKMGYSKTKTLAIDVKKEKDLPTVFLQNGIDVVICMLPIELALTVATAAVDTKIPFVSSNYTYDLIRLDARARERKCIILPEMGLDPGIDLILGRLAADELDTVYGVYSYGGGVPDPEAAKDSPIQYKISWIFDRVLDVYVREAKQIKNGRLHIIPGQELFKKENVHEITFPGIGTLEAYPNGDAERYVNIFGLGDELKEMGRFALRWTGHSQFWRTMVALGLLDNQPMDIGLGEISPRTFLSKCLTPRLQYKENERDIALLRVEACGIKAGKTVKITYDMIDYRDLTTGLFAMNRTVGFTSSIAALMILNGEVTQTGVLSPVRHVPPDRFIEEIKLRGIQINKKIEEQP